MEGDFMTHTPENKFRITWLTLNVARIITGIRLLKYKL